MSRRRRLHVPGGLYYIVQRGNAHQPIFSIPADYELFERLLAMALARTGAHVHAYCWTPDEIRMVAQPQVAPVCRLMQRLTGRYARCMHERAGKSGHFFGQRYRAVLIDPDTYLLPLVRYLHHLPRRRGLSGDLHDYPHTSELAYTHERPQRWLTLRTVLRMIETRAGGKSYAAFMVREPTPEEIALFERAESSDIRALGSPQFLDSLPRDARAYKTRTTLEEIIATVTCTLGVEREHVLSSSRRRELTLARALIAWYATERGISTLTEVARRMRRDPSTLSMAINRYRARRPELFKLTALHDLAPLAPVSLRSPVEGREIPSRL
ncbi:MAG TPA: helix-turn-helix domain-containing protein [Steroidobacteraceae bacterium]|jgi:REP element-mobilizing transposase RayT